MVRAKLGVFAAALAVASFGLVAPALPAQASAQTTWWPYGVYPNRSECMDVGAYQVAQGFYLAYVCNRQSDGTYLLLVKDYF